MISKSYEKGHGDTTINGDGDRGFTIPQRYPVPATDQERRKPIVIDLSDLNGQDGGKGMPKNFVRKAGRVLPSFEKYWSPEEVKDDVNNGYDIE